MKNFRLNTPLFRHLFVVLVGLFVCCFLGVIQLHYPRAYENDPLRTPVQVESVSGFKLTLQDGRVLNVDTAEESLDRIIQESGYRVDIEPLPRSSHLVVYAKRRGWICGTPWLGVIEIPVIPDDVPINRRVQIGTATVADQRLE
jgi:hypothetical protein